MPKGRFCRQCGYDLAGIGSGACPECSRAFDQSDPGTYDAVPRATRRRRLIRRTVIALALLTAIVSMFPRGYVQGTLTVNGAGATATHTVRTELLPPRWLARVGSFRYPGWTSRSEVPHASYTSFTARGKRFGLSGSTSLGGCTASGMATPESPLTINGEVATPENAAAVFETVLPGMAAGTGFGVRTGRQFNQR